MTEITGYKCGCCKTIYEIKEQCELCEKSHCRTMKTDVYFDNPIAFKNDFFPSRLILTDNETSKQAVYAREK